MKLLAVLTDFLAEFVKGPRGRDRLAGMILGALALGLAFMARELSLSPASAGQVETVDTRIARVEERLGFQAEQAARTAAACERIDGKVDRLAEQFLELTAELRRRRR